MLAMSALCLYLNSAPCQYTMFKSYTVPLRLSTCALLQEEVVRILRENNLACELEGSLVLSSCLKDDLPIPMVSLWCCCHVSKTSFPLPWYYIFHYQKVFSVMQSIYTNSSHIPRQLTSTMCFNKINQSYLVYSNLILRLSKHTHFKWLCSY